MRIICDLCSLPISGTVKKAAGNLNCHQECLAQLVKEAEPALRVVSWQSQESSGKAQNWKDPMLGASSK